MKPETWAMPNGPRCRPLGRAALRLVGFAASIAIAGCSQLPSSFMPDRRAQEASLVRYHTVALIAERDDVPGRMARAAYKDGRVTNAEYDDVMAADDELENTKGEVVKQQAIAKWASK